MTLQPLALVCLRTRPDATFQVVNVNDSSDCVWVRHFPLPLFKGKDHLLLEKCLRAHTAQNHHPAGDVAELTKSHGTAVELDQGTHLASGVSCRLSQQRRLLLLSPYGECGRPRVPAVL
jgi:hypothetical protein